MGSWHEWVEDKVKNALSNDSEKHDYTSLIPQRNPNDPADRALKAAGAGIYSGVAGETPAKVGTAIQDTGLAPETGGAIRAFGEANKIPANYPTGWERGIHNVAEGVSSNLAIPAVAGLTGAGMIPGAIADTVANQFAGSQRANEAKLPQVKEAIPPDMAIGHTPGSYPLANAALNPPPAASPAVPETRPDEPIYVGSGRGTPLPPGPQVQGGDGGTMPTTAIQDFSRNDFNRWDVARGLQQNGVNVPTMTRAEMVAALQPQPGRGGIANLGTMPDKQLRDLMDRHGLNYFKMSDEEMQKAYAPFDRSQAGGTPGGNSYTVPPEKEAAFTARIKELGGSDKAFHQAAKEFGLTPEKQPAPRGTALFTGDEGKASPGAVPTSADERRNMGYRMLQQYMQNPEKYGPHFGVNAINSIHAIGPDIELPANAESNRNLQGAQAEEARAKSTLVPSQINENEARAGYLNAEGKNKIIATPPGYKLMQPSETHGNPATEVGQGNPERASNPDAQVHMDENDKMMLQGAFHVLGQLGEMAPPEAKKPYQDVIEHINSKYARAAKPNINREQALTKMKATGKYTDAQINAKLKEMGL
jgi:hypothetical protein